MQNQQQKQKEVQNVSAIAAAAATKTNEEIIKEYLDQMQTEINPSINYGKINRNTLTKLSRFHKNKVC